jgi:hypothetical protein
MWESFAEEGKGGAYGPGLLPLHQNLVGKHLGMCYEKIGPEELRHT